MINLASSVLPPILPPHLSLEGKALVSAPSDSPDEKEKKEVTTYFLRFFQENFRKERPVSLQALKLTDQYLIRMGVEGKEPISKELASLERYSLAAHLRLQDLKSVAALKKRCSEHDLQHFHSRWVCYQVEQGGTDNLFFQEPDLVDFVFETHLHRYIRYPSYDHHIIQSEDGRASLLHDGEYKSWPHIKLLLEKNRREFIDLKGSPSYGLEGLTAKSKLRCLNKLQNPPEKSQLQIVVAMQTSDYNCLQRPCLGGDHSFARLILGKEMKDLAGEVYSFGFLPKDPTHFTLLNSIEGGFYAPDFVEFSKHPLRVGTCDLLPGQGEKLFEALKTQEQSPLVFNALHDNCHGNLISFLHAQGLLRDLDVLEPLSAVVYRTFLPECVQLALNFLFSYVPECLQKIYRLTLDFFTSLIILSPLGAWMKEDRATQAVFENFSDLIDPKKAYVSTAAKIIEWQALHDPQTTLFACGEES